MSSWLPGRCSPSAALTQLAQQHSCPLAGPAWPLRPQNEEEAPEVSTRWVSISERASSVQGSPAQWVQGWCAWELDPSTAMALEPKTCSMVTGH